MAPSLMTKNESSIISNLERIEEQKNNLENIFEGSQNSGSNGFKNLDEINKMCQDLEEKLPELARLAISTNLSVTLLDRISLLRESAVTLLSKISTGDTNLTISYANQIKNLEEYDMISLIQLEENEDKDEKTRSKSPRLVDRFLGEGLMIEFLEFYSNDIEYTKTIDDLISTTVEQLCSEYTKESEYPKNDFGDADQKKLIAIILNHSGQEIVLKNINIPLEPLKSLVLKSKNACNLFSECKTTNTLSLHDRLVKLTVATW